MANVWRARFFLSDFFEDARARARQCETNHELSPCQRSVFAIRQLTPAGTDHERLLKRVRRRRRLLIAAWRVVLLLLLLLLLIVVLRLRVLLLLLILLVLLLY